MKKTAMIALAMSALIFAACRHTSDSDYEAEQMEFVKEQEELEAEQEELRREYEKMKEEYLREKAEFQKEQQALKKGVIKERNTKAIKRDSTKRQLNENEASELTDKVKSAGLWPTDK